MRNSTSPYHTSVVQAASSPTSQSLFWSSGTTPALPLVPPTCPPRSVLPCPSNFIALLYTASLTHLPRMSLADAQSLAIRKLLSPSAYDSTLTPGPPLPKSHPSTALLAKLHLECASLYSSALTLSTTPEKVRSSSTSSDIGSTSGQVLGDLKRHLADEATFHTALAHKWLGVDAGDSSIAAKAGDAVGYLAWAKRELEDLTGGFRGPRLRKEKPNSDGRGIKARATQELEKVALFLTHYKRMNDSVRRQTRVVLQLTDGI